MMSRTKLRKRLAKHCNHKPVELPELKDLYPALLVSGDEIPEQGHMWYTPDGQPIPADIECVAYAERLSEIAHLVFGDYKNRPENRIVSSPFYRHGVRVVVSTVYLGLNHGYGSIPLFWETMVFVGNGAADSYCTRYASRKAAYAGHAQTVQAIREGQHARRQAWENRPQRVLMTQKQTIRRKELVRA